jgi:hypothetical protein
LWARVEGVERRAGSNWLILCDSRWADEGVFDWGVLKYPDMDSYQLKVSELEKLNWWRYWSSSRTLLGHQDGPAEPIAIAMSAGTGYRTTRTCSDAGPSGITASGAPVCA